MLDRSAKGIGLGQFTIFGDDAVAGGKITARVGMEGVADATGVAGTEGASNLTVGGDFAFGDSANELVDLGEKIGHLSYNTAL